MVQILLRINVILLNFITLFQSAFLESCTPDRFYCGHQLTQVSQKERLQNTTLWQCGTDGKSLTFSYYCSFGCKIIQNGDSYCLCLHNKAYCDHELNDIGWKANENAVYKCINEGLNASLIKTCAYHCKAASHGQSYCFRQCEDGKNYCGDELRELGWEGYERNSLYRCSGSEVVWIASCNNCNNRGTGSKCDCTSGFKYCGSQLNQNGYQGYKNDSIYLCEDALLPLADTGETNILCIHKCIPGHSYCGHELQYVQNIAQDDLQRRYICMDDKSFQSTSLCGKCITNNDTGAYCYCVPGWRHCASVFYTPGWKVFGKSLETAIPNNVTNDTIFRCKDEKNIEYIESCAKNECQYKSIGGAYCVCSPNLTYCGHELYEHYNSMDTKLDPNYIYRCSETTSTVIEKERCRKCLRLYGKPICRHEFSTPLFVGGIAALVFFSLGFVFIWHIIFQKRRLKKLMESKRIDEAQLTVSKKRLGQGEFGEVWRFTCTNSEGNSRDVALSKRRTNARNCILKEVMILDVISHQNVIKVFGVCLNFIDECGNSLPALVLEYMNGGNAISYMRSERHRLNGQDLLHIFQDICQAGDHLCKLGFIHRDIATHNVLVQKNSQTGHVIVAKLTDFRLAKDIGKLASMHKDTNHDQTKLPFRYSAPEGFERCFCFKSDVWSFGVFMWELYTVMEEDDEMADLRLKQGIPGPVPYPELNSVADVLAEVLSERRLKQPRMAPEKMYSIMRQCWATQEELRPSFEELIKFFNTNCDGSEIQPIVTGVDASQLKTIKLLGEGEFGEVWQSTHTNPWGIFLCHVALKLSKGRADAANCFEQEVITLDFVNHRNIIKAFGICFNFKDQYGSTVPALILECINGGNAISYMRSERNRLDGQDLLRIFLDICQAGDHLCTLGIIHRDIGARNVLVQKDLITGHVVVAKLTDFGLALDIGKLTSMYKATNLDGDMFHFRYTAPEGFQGCFCSKSDVWSFGVLMWELYTVMEEQDALADLRLEQGRSGPKPYSELDTVAYVLAEACSERKLKQPRMAPEKMYMIMRQCWMTQEELRPSFEELIGFFNKDCYGSEILAIATGSAVSDLKTGHSEKRVGNNGIPDGYVGGLS